MQTMKLLMERIDDELQDACSYAKLALEYQDSEPELANLFERLSGEEMTHATALHNCVMAHIETYRQKGRPVPEAMTAVYECLHERQIDKSAKVRLLQKMHSER